MARSDEGESFAALFERSADAHKGRQRFRVGERLDVTVVAIGRDAVFADLGGKQEGYFDRVELSGPDGTLRVEVGANIAAVVAQVDDRVGQVRLSPVFVRRASETADGPAVDPDLGVSIPVARSAPLLIEGARVAGKITGVERYGVFVQIDGTHGRGGRGLVPTSETATPRGADLKKHFTVGQDVAAKILAIAEDGKIRLSIAALKADDERGEYESYLSGGTGDKPAGEGATDAAAESGSKAGPTGNKPKKKPEPRGFGTLGDLLAQRKK